MTHREFLKSLSAEERSALTRTADLPGVLRLSWHWGAILGLGAWIAAGWPLWWAAILPQGILIVFLFTLLHETVHDTPFRSRWLNRLAGVVSAFLIFLPPTWFRYFHLAHHRFTNDPAHDPELASPRPETWSQYLFYLSGLDYLRGNLSALVQQALGQADATYLPERRKARIRWEARAMILVYGVAVALLISGQAWVFWCWWLPFLIGQPFLRAYLLAEHGRCPQVADMFVNTRTTYTAATVRLIAWNMPYHAEHHTYPLVPFWKLPKLHRLIRDRLQSTSLGYVAFHRDYTQHLD